MKSLHHLWTPYETRFVDGRAASSREPRGDVIKPHHDLGRRRAKNHPHLHDDTSTDMIVRVNKDLLLACLYSNNMRRSP